MSQSFDELIRIMARLRGPGGCPWDHEQTHQSIVPQLIEETYEAIGAIESNNMPNLCEELGDLMLHIVFHAQIASETDDFTAEDILKGLNAKLIRRHPHVFGDAEVKDSAEVMKNWDEIKATEKKNHTGNSLLDSIPTALPALFQSFKLSKKASKSGFDWKKAEDVFEKIEEEIRELKEAVRYQKSDNIEEEMGDLFFALANLSRHLSVQPEEALRRSNQKFRKRFSSMEKIISQKGQTMDKLSLNEWNDLWETAKKETA